MKRKVCYLGVILILSLGLSACGKKEVVEEPPYSVNGLSILPVPTDVTSETLPDIISEEIIEESTSQEIIKESIIEESTIETNVEEEIVESSNPLINNYWKCEALGIFYYFDEDSYSTLTDGISIDGEYTFVDNVLTIDGEDAEVVFNNDSMILTADGFGFVFEKATKEDWDKEVGMPFDYESEFVGMTLNEFIATGIEFHEGYTGIGNVYLFEAANPNTKDSYEFIMSGDEVAAKLDEKELGESVIDYLGDFPIEAIRVYSYEEYLNCKLDLSIYKDKTVNDLSLDGFNSFQVELINEEENIYEFKAWDYNFNFYSRPVIITLDETAQPIMNEYAGFLEEKELFDNLKDFTILDIVYEEDLDSIE